MNKKKGKIKVPEYLKRLLEIVGEEAYKQIIADYGGTSIYIPLGLDYSREERNIMVFEEFKKGESYKDLARKYGMSESTIRKIVKMMREGK